MARAHSQRGNVESDGLPALVAARHRLAMVYGGGGVFGIAYTAGVAEGLSATGIPVVEAPSLGNSAGSWTASAIRWFVDETYVKVSWVWSYVYRVVDQHGQVTDGYVSQRRDIASARRFFTAVLAAHGDPREVITDRAPALAKVIEELLPAAWHNTGQYENNRVEYDHGRLKARLRPMRG